MRFYKAKIILIASFLVVGFLGTPAQAESIQLVVAAEHATGYNRALFKHWIDADKDGCDTRAEVLIEEAITKPKIGTKCKLTGGKWFSTYDGKTVANASLLDVDHLVPLAEAWRSGAWKWSTAQRQAYANDLDDKRSLIAVTLSTNRSKGDKDPSLWMPSVDKCVYLVNWIIVKWRYSLTTDLAESNAITKISQDCFGESIVRLPPNISKVIEDSSSATATATPTPVVTPTPVSTPSATPTPTPTVSTAPVNTPIPTPVENNNSLIVTPGAFCAPAGAIGNSKTGVLYTCKTSPTDSRNRWRQ